MAALLDSSGRGWQVEDTASLLLGLEQGAQALVQVSFCFRVKQDRLAIGCTEGILVAEPFEQGRICIYQKEGQTEHEAPPLPRERRQVPLIENFVDHVQHGSPLLCPVEEALETTRILQDASRAAGGASAPSAET